MVRVRILEARAGHADERYHLPDNFSFQPGAIEEFDDELAEAWIAAGIVEAVDDEPRAKSERAKHEAHQKHEAKPEPKPAPRPESREKKPVIRAHSHLRGSK